MINQPKKITVAYPAGAKPGKAVTIDLSIVIEPRWFEPHGCLQTVVDSAAPGFIRNLMLGSEGLQIRHHENWVVIPKDLLLEIAEKLDPELKPPTARQVAANAAANTKLIPPAPQSQALAGQAPNA